jgi:AraC-like DNA-binding protein
MHVLKVRQPRPELRPYVRTFVQRNMGRTTSVVVEPTTAQLEQILAFDFGTPVEALYPDGRVQVIDATSAGGAQTSFACHMHLRAGAESFGVFFQPTGFSLLFGIPICELTNRQGDSSAIVGQSVRTLWNQMGESSSFENRVLIAEEFLMYRAARMQARGMITAAADYIFRQHGAVRIADVANRGSTGLRQFEREFHREIGAPPKVFARIARFQSALDAKVSAPKRTWLDIAHSFGYYDQMHMIHDFETLGRDSPTRLVAQLGDSRPPALASAESKQADTVAFLLGGASQVA